MILGPEGETLAEHHNFPNPETAIREGTDIIPKMTRLRSYESPGRAGDTERGREIDSVIALLLQLIDAYRMGQLQEKPLS